MIIKDMVYYFVSSACGVVFKTHWSLRSLKIMKPWSPWATRRTRSTCSCICRMRNPVRATQTFRCLPQLLATHSWILWHLMTQLRSNGQWLYTFNGLRITIRIRLQMPGAGAPSPVSVPERITGVKLKESLSSIEELAWREDTLNRGCLLHLRSIHIYLTWCFGICPSATSLFNDVFRVSQPFYG